MPDDLTRPQSAASKSSRKPDPAKPAHGEMRQVFDSDRYPYRYKMACTVAEAEKARLQAEPLKVQQWAI